MTPEELACRIDHTLLASEATPERIDVLCDEAVEYGFAGVCVQPVYVKRVAARLESASTAGSGPRRPAVISVAGFPLGGSTTETKADEARRAGHDGATEIDMVIPLGALVSGDRTAVCHDIEGVACAVHDTIEDGILKVIVETAALTTEQIEAACACCRDGGADFVKTSTGFHARGGATVEHVRQLCRFGAPLRVKASGGLRTAPAALAMLEAGAARLGTSSGVAIMRELRGGAS
jgi:deoxyribose-phosphate aldolase